MRPLANIPIEQKLRLLVAVVVALTLMAGGGVFVPWALKRFALEQEGELRSMAASVGFSASFSMDGLELNPDRMEEARMELKQVLERMAGHPSITAAAIYRIGLTDRASKLSGYQRAGTSEAPDQMPALGYNPASLELTVEALDLQDNVAGRVYMRGDLRRKREFELRLWKTVAVALACAVGVTLLAGYLSQRALIGPLQGLLNTTRRVREDRDYTARADVGGTDEIGQLGAGLNQMLEQIGFQDEALRLHQLGLEEQVAERTQELRAANLELIGAKEAAESANRAKTTFLANISHELRTPLNAIIGYSEMIREELVGGESGRLTADIDRINRSGKMLLSLINDILDLSKIEAGRMTLAVERFDVVVLLKEVRDDLQPLAEVGGNRLLWESGVDRLMIRADRQKVRQIANNLISNACKFTSGGAVRLRLSTSGSGVEEQVVFEVEDDGQGMSAEELERVFEPFVQATASTHRSHGGTGLGLPISRRLCRAMGGELSARSEPGVGSVFRATFSRLVSQLPDRHSSLAMDDSSSDTFPVPQVVSPSRNRLVLVIDDDRVARDILCRQLRRNGFDVMPAENGSEGLRLARERLPDVITLDVCMPGMTGLEFARELRSDSRLATIPILIVTMLEEVDPELREISAGCHQKPVELARFLEVLVRVTGC